MFYSSAFLLRSLHYLVYIVSTAHIGSKRYCIFFTIIPAQSVYKMQNIPVPYYMYKLNIIMSNISAQVSSS